MARPGGGVVAGLVGAVGVVVGYQHRWSLIYGAGLVVLTAAVVVVAGRWLSTERAGPRSRWIGGLVLAVAPLLALTAWWVPHRPASAPQTVGRTVLALTGDDPQLGATGDGWVLTPGDGTTYVLATRPGPLARLGHLDDDRGRAAFVAVGPVATVELPGDGSVTARSRDGAVRWTSRWPEADDLVVVAVGPDGTAIVAARDATAGPGAGGWTLHGVGPDGRERWRRRAVVSVPGRTPPVVPPLLVDGSDAVRAQVVSPDRGTTVTLDPDTRWAPDPVVLEDGYALFARTAGPVADRLAGGGSVPGTCAVQIVDRSLRPAGGPRFVPCPEDRPVIAGDDGSVLVEYEGGVAVLPAGGRGVRLFRDGPGRWRRASSSGVVTVADGRVWIGADDDPVPALRRPGVVVADADDRWLVTAARGRAGRFDDRPRYVVEVRDRVSGAVCASASFAREPADVAPTGRCSAAVVVGNGLAVVGGDG